MCRKSCGFLVEPHTWQNTRLAQIPFGMPDHVTLEFIPVLSCPCSKKCRRHGRYGACRWHWWVFKHGLSPAMNRRVTRWTIRYADLIGEWLEAFLHMQQTMCRKSCGFLAKLHTWHNTRLPQIPSGMPDHVMPEFIPVYWAVPVTKSAIGMADMERAAGTDGFLGMAFDSFFGTQDFFTKIKAGNFKCPLYGFYG